MDTNGNSNLDNQHPGVGGRDALGSDEKTAQQQMQGIPGPRCECVSFLQKPFNMNSIPSDELPGPSQGRAYMDVNSLLLKFNCLGITDHEDLINQFHTLTDNRLNENMVCFFLEMSNWNLQLGIGCYLDFCNAQVLPSMKILRECKPNHEQITWTLQNTGYDIWPKGCYLMSKSQTRRVEVPALEPGYRCDVVVDINTHVPIVWRLFTPYGEYFGDSLRLEPPGYLKTDEDIYQQLGQLSATCLNPAQIPQVNIVIAEKMD